jgi:hypothetical protein
MASNSDEYELHQHTLTDNIILILIKENINNQNLN